MLIESHHIAPGARVICNKRYGSPEPPLTSSLSVVLTMLNAVCDCSCPSRDALFNSLIRYRQSIQRICCTTTPSSIPSDRLWPSRCRPPTKILIHHDICGDNPGRKRRLAGGGREVFIWRGRRLDGDNLSTRQKR